MDGQPETARAQPMCHVCGSTARYLQRVSRAHPVDYYECEDCGRIFSADKELSAHWRRIGLVPMSLD